MSEHEKHTEFLKWCIRYDEDGRCQKLRIEIHQIQCDSRCVQRARWLMGIFTSLAGAGLVYSAILVEDFSRTVPQFVMNLIFALGLASLFCFLVFTGLGMIYRMKLDQRREECRQRVTWLLESRLGKVTTPFRDNRVGTEDASRIREIAETAPGSSMERIDQGSRS